MLPHEDECNESAGRCAAGPQTGCARPSADSANAPPKQNWGSRYPGGLLGLRAPQSPFEGYLDPQFCQPPGA